MMVNTTNQNVVEQLKSWLRTINPNINDVDLDVDLLESRTIDSLNFVEFILYIEELSGREVYDMLDKLRTLRSIRDNVFAA